MGRRSGQSREEVRVRLVEGVEFPLGGVELRGGSEQQLLLCVAGGALGSKIELLRESVA